MQTKEQKGSALVFSLVVLSMILVAALGVASVSVVEKKNSSATGKSTQAFQVADSAVEVVLKYAALDPAGTTLDELKSSFNGTVNGTPVVATCDANGVISGAISGGTVDLTFVDADGATLTDCMGSNLSQVATVKSVGRSGDTTRAINSAVAAGTLAWTNLSNSDLGNGWDNGWTTTGYDNVGYAKDSRTGIVYLKGLAWHGTAFENLTDGTGALFTLPSEYRPNKRKVFHVIGNNAALEWKCRVDIYSDGRVEAYTACKWLGLDIIYFPTGPTN